MEQLWKLLVLSATLGIVLALHGQRTDEHEVSVDGIVTAQSTGMPIARAKVSAYKEESANLPIVTYTDDSGRFRIQAIDPGRYVFVAERNGYITQKYGKETQTAGGTVLRLTPAMHLHDMNFQLISAGIVTGRVEQYNGEAAEAAVVQLYATEIIHGQERLIAPHNATTDDRGEFRAFGLEPRRYYVCAAIPETDRGYKPAKGSPAEQRSTPTCFPDVQDIRQATPIEVKGGVETTVSIILGKSTTFHIIGTIRGFSTGLVTPARVTLQPDNPSYDVVYPGRDTLASSQGKFDLAGIIPGTYTISTVLSRDGIVYGAWQRVDVSTSNVDVNLVPVPRFTIRGNIKLVNGSDAPMQLLTVALKPLNSPIVSSSTLLAHPNKKGEFAIVGVDHDVYELQIGKLPPDSYIQSVQVNREWVAPDAIDLSSPDISAGVAIEITLAGRGARVEGVVLDAQAQPFGGALVVITSVSDASGNYSKFREVNTDQTGRFSIRGVAPGSYRLFAWEDNTVPYKNPEFLKPYQSQSTELTLHENDQESVRLSIASNDSKQ
ncbi:MAG TPA: carboxypeptidase-like regulatory domain-containing protein [Candidatus Eisenbacteria bacterium]|nr:carboxypeptidase-like regulatory domain-containing protein [Candidatus Eisenbacteria bacterium]